MTIQATFPPFKSITDKDYSETALIDLCKYYNMMYLKYSELYLEEYKKSWDARGN